MLPDPLDLRDCSAERVGVVASTAHCEAQTLAHGIAAIGELLAFTADVGELERDTARNIGWLIKSLGELTGRLADTANGADYELERRKETTN